MDDGDDRPTPPDLPKYVREPLERQSPDTLDAIADYAMALASWKRTERQRELERSRTVVQTLLAQGEPWDVQVAGESVPVRADVSMLCGCPIEPGGLWDADRIDVTARLVRDGRVLRETEMSYAGETNIFEGTITPPSAGSYELVVLAAEPGRANFGRVETRVNVRGD